MKSLYLLFKRIDKFGRLGGFEKRLLIEAFLITGLTRIRLIFIGFSKLAKKMGTFKEESSAKVSIQDKLITRKIAWAVSVVSKLTPWESKCLVKALTAQIMLKHRNLSSTLYLGVAKDEDNKLIAHAWLRCGTDIITGDDGRTKFTVVAKFANTLGR